MINNIDPTREDVLSVVDDINGMYQDIQYNNADLPEYLMPCIYEEANDCYHIKLLGTIVWDSENDDRPYKHMDSLISEEKQDLKEYVRNEIRMITVGLLELLNYKEEK